MKRKGFLALISTLLLGGLTSCGPKSGPIEYTDKLAPSSQEGVILHAFNWSFNTIKENLPAIKEAGYTSVQTSPVQQPKGGGANWWSLYQPVSFSIATSSSLGNKEDLKELCEEAEKYGIKIIADIVFNHMATTGGLDEWGDPEVDPEVLIYEPLIYAGREHTFHHVTEPVGIQNTTHCYDGLPDLNTSNPLVQERALSLLKECIDVGIDGFRFDAAKHIETPSDGNCASSFWDNTLEVAKTYYTEKTGKTLFAYGEILNDCENGRKLNIYTDKYFGVTDNAYSNAVTNYIGGKNVEKAINQDYAKKADTNKLVLWAESHDTYESASNKPGQARIDRSWALVGSRKDATALYFARPNEVEEMGKEGTTAWNSEHVASINRFHNRFVGAEEYLSAQQETAFVVERYSENDFGAVVVNTAGEDELKIKFENIPNGDYYDSITGNIIEVRGHKANIKFDKQGVVVLTLTPCIARPTLSFSTPSTMYAGSLDLTLETKNAEKAYYQINGGEKVEFKDKVKITIGENVKSEETTTVKLVVQNGEHTKEKTMRYTKLKLVEGFVNVVNINLAYLLTNDIYIWCWNESGLNLWTNEYTLLGSTLLFDAEEAGATGFLLALFPKGHTIENVNKWDSAVVKQSGDIDVSKGFYDASSF